ncbi:MAG: N-acetylmuramoyl-L-alanine amidase [Oscillospiraceae bacterium]|nr:N-acetylmuramoyl-L-alanine amidase [Oscillospiraceae bacterium]
MIKTIKLSNVIFFFLMLLTVLVAFIFVLLTRNTDFSFLSASGKTRTPVLVIDAGHGGEDGGAVSLSGVYESKINLDVALKMAALSDLTGVEYRLTRDSEDITYPDSAKTISSRKRFDQKRRVEFINATPNAVLISIHQNFYPHKSPHGPQSFFAKVEGSDSLAKLIQNALNLSLCPENRRIAMPVAKDVFLFKNVSCPAVLVECGFISNPEESKLLDTESYRLKIAAALTCSYFQYLETNY